MSGVKISISVTNQTWPEGPTGLRDNLIKVAEAADLAGLDTLWVPDHLLQADPTVSADATDMLEAYTTLGFLAARTERVRLGAMVTAVTFRPPALLIKAVTSLDVLTGGRAWLGIGAGYHGEEADRMGLPLGPVAERFERLEETLELAQRMWRGDQRPFEGKHYRLSAPTGLPLPLSGHPPILIGGDGEKKTLRLVAKYADACNLFDIPDGGATVRRKLAVLARHCADLGRPYQEITKTLAMRLGPTETSEEFVRRVRDQAKLGIDHVGLVMSQAWTPETIKVLAAAVPELAEVEPNREPPESAV
ncbi:TIGR03560 family F420-dependent LLM class oxidoreductase [Microlunatus parietis]|uniref:F420-dependent oxidoreductase-like protein n=1 Tax=Microlunatus parietis TaxID=682979 RepID=A0A7Y9I4C4_9ACTN|nr:TIGR03560 family F420-dependent LLM class oxidoreductase [Microlunatus parietis]NYE69999.1 F420-dependent oxidoreductase-like protein [Microlunatus parietis]